MSVLQWILGTGDIKDINVYNGITYIFIHIKSHTSITMNGNDLVDHLAKHAMLHAWERLTLKRSN